MLVIMTLLYILSTICPCNLSESPKGASLGKARSPRALLVVSVYSAGGSFGYSQKTHCPLAYLVRFFKDLPSFPQSSL